MTEQSDQPTMPDELEKHVIDRTEEETAAARKAAKEGLIGAGFSEEDAEKVLGPAYDSGSGSEEDRREELLQEATDQAIELVEYMVENGLTQEVGEEIADAALASMRETHPPYLPVASAMAEALAGGDMGAIMGAGIPMMPEEDMKASIPLMSVGDMMEGRREPSEETINDFKAMQVASAAGIRPCNIDVPLPTPMSDIDSMTDDQMRDHLITLRSETLGVSREDSEEWLESKQAFDEAITAVERVFSDSYYEACGRLGRIVGRMCEGPLTIEEAIEREKDGLVMPGDIYQKITEALTEQEK